MHMCFDDCCWADYIGGNHRAAVDRMDIGFRRDQRSALLHLYMNLSVIGDMRVVDVR